MATIEDIDLESFISSTIIDVFDTMLSMKAVMVDEAQGPANGTGPRIVGSVGLSGEVMGNVSIQVTRMFAYEMTSAMLGMELDDIEEDEVHDVVGEISNMLGGDIKSRLCDEGFPCSLSIPSITSGTDFTIESTGWSRHEVFTFSCDDYRIVIEVFVRPAG
jgi:CheY-specific phosphatase CheX